MFSKHRGKILTAAGVGLIAGTWYYANDYLKLAWSLLSFEDSFESKQSIRSETSEEKYRKLLLAADDAASKQTAQICREELKLHYKDELESLQSSLKNRDLPEDTKKCLFLRLQELCFSRTCTALALHALNVTVTRIQVLVVAAQDQSGSLNQLSSIDSELIKQLDDAIRNLVKTEFGRRGYVPDLEISSQDYGNFISGIFSVIPSLCFKVPLNAIAKNSACFRRLTDILSSCQFRRCLEDVFSIFADKFCKRTLKDNCSFAIATRIGPTKQEFDHLLNGSPDLDLEIPSLNALTNSIYGLGEEQGESVVDEKALLALFQQIAGEEYKL